MSLTVRFIKQHKHLGLTLPVHGNHSYPPVNGNIHIDNDVDIKIVSPNANGLIPFSTPCSCRDACGSVKSVDLLHGQAQL